MIPNGVRQNWAAGKPVVNGWLSIACPFTAEIMAAQVYDSITIDLQHGLVGYEMATAMLQAMRASGVTPMVRAAWLHPADIMRALDAGAYGVICPMINTREEAERLVSYVRYPPDGVRSFGPTRANFSAGADYGQRADSEVLCLAMIETAEAFANVDAIASTPGLDGLYIGPADLTLGLTGRKYPTGFDREEPEMVDAIKRILNAAHALPLPGS
jgi:4-hydroxy-2-oxoheptanedioate aldolase